MARKKVVHEISPRNGAKEHEKSGPRNKSAKLREIARNSAKEHEIIIEDVTLKGGVFFLLVNETTSQRVNETTSQQDNESTRQRVNKTTSQRVSDVDLKTL